MAYPRPKILTRVTVPTGGWAWTIKVSVSSALDTTLSGTVPAGDYFVCGDNQSDDLLYALMSSIQTEIDGGPGGDRDCIIYIDHDDRHVIKFKFAGADFVGVTKSKVQLTCTSWASGLTTALGVRDIVNITELIENEATLTLNYQHAYGWYSDEDGQINNIGPSDSSMSNSIQGKSISGKVKTQFFGDSFGNELVLQHLERYSNGYTKVHSDAVGYGSDPVYPYNRNEPLECWWQEARKGIEFRVYGSARLNTIVANDRGVADVTTTTRLYDTNKYWSTYDSTYSILGDTNIWAGCYVWIPEYRPGSVTSGVPTGFYISSGGITYVDVPNAHPSGYDVDGNTGGAAGGSYYLFRHTYKTYVVDLKRMSKFMPRELPVIDRWNITIPLLRFVS